MRWPRPGSNLIRGKGELSQDFLLEKCAQAFRYYGRVPTAIELRMYSKLDPEFPSHTTIGNHFRGKPDMIEELRSWLAQREDYLDVAKLLPAPPTEERWETRGRRTRSPRDTSI